MKKAIVFSAFIALFFSCESEKQIQKPKSKIVETNEIIGIETLFLEKEFSNPKHLELLKELKICSEFQTDTSNYFEPACSPKFFKIFPMDKKTPVENAFLLQIKSKVSGIKLRRLVAFIRERGQLVKVNTFVANLIGMRNKTNGYSDLLLRFNENVEGEIIFYNCLFTWDGKKYKFQTVELIEGMDWRQRLKPEFKDSVSQEIYSDLIKNEMIL